MSEAKRRDDHPATPFCSAEDARQAWTSSLPEKVQRVKSFKLQLLVGVIIHFLFLGLFGFFFVETYSSKTTSKFLSLDPDAGDCESIPITTSGKYLLDSSGNFDFNLLFNPAEAMFEVIFVQYEGDEDTYLRDMVVLDGIIVDVLTEMRSFSDLARKFELLVSWRGAVPAEKGGYVNVWFNSDPVSALILVN